MADRRTRAPLPVSTYIKADDECPHCREVVRDLWDHGWDGDGEDEEVETECGRCERPIKIRRRIDVRYVVSE